MAQTQARRDIGTADYSVNQALAIIRLLFEANQHQDTEFATVANYSLSSALDALQDAAETLAELV